MGKIIEIRGVPDRVYATLVDVAESQGLPLTDYLQRELTWLVDRRGAVQHNLDVIRAAQAQVPTPLDRQTILDAIEEGRAERWP